MLVPPIVERGDNNRFKLIDGVNRVHCAKKLGWTTIRVSIFNSSNEIDRVLIGLKVNINRSSHDPMGFARAILHLKKLGLKQKDIAQRLGFTKGHISKLMSLNKLEPQDKLALAKGQLTIPQAYRLVRKPRDRELLERLGVQGKCDFCHSKVDFRNRELCQICVDCSGKLASLLLSERKKRDREDSQRALP